jgi:hypothetical protein
MLYQGSHFIADSSLSALLDAKKGAHTEPSIWQRKRAKEEMGRKLRTDLEMVSKGAQAL